jgi:Transposase DDE domain
MPEKKPPGCLGGFKRSRIVEGGYRRRWPDFFLWSFRCEAVHEEARDHARQLAGTPQFEQSRNERKKVEMLFAHLKTTLRFERMRLRGLSGARDEFLMVAIAQNLRRLAHLTMPMAPA